MSDYYRTFVFMLCGQAKEWLTAVNQGKYDAYVALVVFHLEEALQPQPAATSSTSNGNGNGSKQTVARGAAAAASKRKYDISSSFLGTTTIAGRSKRNGVVNATASSSSSSSGGVGLTAASVTAGRILATLKLPTLKPPTSSTSTTTSPTITDEERAAAEEYFANLISQRSQFEIRRREALEVRRKEIQRLTHETASLHRTLGGNSTSSSGSSGMNGAVEKQGKDLSAVELKGKASCYVLNLHDTVVILVIYITIIIIIAPTQGEEADVAGTSSEVDLDALFGGHVTVIKATSLPTTIKAQPETDRVSPPIDSTAATTTTLTGKRKLIDTNTTPSPLPSAATAPDQNKLAKTAHLTSTATTPTTDIPSTIQPAVKVKKSTAVTTTATESTAETSLKSGVSPTVPVAKKAKRKFVIG